VNTVTNTDAVTPPLDESKGSTVTVSLRLSQDLADRLDARRGELSRNAWAIKCFEWVLTYLPTGLAHPERDRVASDAPPAVAGTRRQPPAPHVHAWEREGNERICHGCGEVRKNTAPKEPAF
jgi:hypothetical protein